VLGLPATASMRDVKRAYHKLALEHHPDKKNADGLSDDMFVQIQAAYSQLKKRFAKGDDSEVRQLVLCPLCCDD
jgi:DnaJ-class molecular chaperone